MSKPNQGSVGVALTICALIVVSVSSVGYYQFVYYPTVKASASTTTTFQGRAVNITIVPGASTLTTTAYAPDVVKLVIGVNNTVVFYNNDSASGGVAHTATDRGGAFDTGVLQFGQSSAPITITKAGTYNYYCQIHPNTMVGQIVVVAGTGGGGAQTSSVSSTASSAGGSITSASAPPALAVSIVKGAATNQSSLGYSPDSLTVVIGVNNSVYWANNDTAPHTVTAVAGAPQSFDSGIVKAGSGFAYTFTTPGTYQYVCKLHSWMKGTVIVKSA